MISGALSNTDEAAENGSAESGAGGRQMCSWEDGSHVTLDLHWLSRTGRRVVC